MNYKELQALLTEANKLNNTGNYDEVELLANKVLSALDHTPIGLNNDYSLRADAILALASNNFQRGNYDQALYQLHQVLALTEEHNLIDTQPNVHNLFGNVYLNLAEYDQALEYYDKALKGHEQLDVKIGIARVTGNIGLVYGNLGSHDKALDYFRKALVVYEELDNKSGIARCIGHIGLAYNSLRTYDKALEYFGKALAAHEELNEISRAATVMGHIGVVYKNLDSYDRALEYFGKALAAHEEVGEKLSAAKVNGYIGSLYATQTFDGYNPEQAELYLLKAIALCDDIGAKKNLYENEKALADLYTTTNRIPEAYQHFVRFHEIKEEVQSEEAKKQANRMEQQKQAAEREKEIAIAKATADAKHQATEQLLHNVLPPSIANKMLGGTKLIAEKVPSVSVLFADIVNFTKLSQRITPEELVEGLDRIFSTFDTLAEKHGLEKIKTIGDAYMVVSGAPVQREDHAESMANFALEMLEAIKQFRSISTDEEVQLRIGIHSGEVVAGVIGKKKFAYDLWGDAVNTASRMESHGEPGKIHCTEEFMHAVGTGVYLPIQFTPRDEMDIKGKGMMKTYFLERTT